MPSAISGVDCRLYLRQSLRFELFGGLRIRLGLFIDGLGCGLLAGMLLRPRLEIDTDVTTEQLGFVLGRSVLGEILSDTIVEFEPDLFVREFASTELNRQFHLMALLEKIEGMRHFVVEIVFVDTESELHFLHLLGAGLAFLLLLLLLLFEDEFTVVQITNHHRIALIRNQYEIETPLLGSRNRVGKRHDTELLTIITDNAQFTVAVSPVIFFNQRSDSQGLLKCFSRTRRDAGNTDIGL